MEYKVDWGQAATVKGTRVCGTDGTGNNFMVTC